MGAKITIEQTFHKLHPGKAPAPIYNLNTGDPIIPASSTPTNVALVPDQILSTDQRTSCTVDFAAMSAQEMRTYTASWIAARNFTFSPQYLSRVQSSCTSHGYRAPTPYFAAWSYAWERDTLHGTESQRPVATKFDTATEKKCHNRLCDMHAAGRTAKMTLALAKTKLIRVTKEEIEGETNKEEWVKLRRKLAALEGREIDDEEVEGRRFDALMIGRSATRREDRRDLEALEAGYENGDEWEDVEV